MGDKFGRGRSISYEACATPAQGSSPSGFSSSFGGSSFTSGSNYRPNRPNRRPGRRPNNNRPINVGGILSGIINRDGADSGTVTGDLPPGFSGSSGSSDPILFG